MLCRNCSFISKSSLDKGAWGRQSIDRRIVFWKIGLSDEESCFGPRDLCLVLIENKEMQHVLATIRRFTKTTLVPGLMVSAVGCSQGQGLGKFIWQSGSQMDVPSGGVARAAGLANDYEQNALAILQSNCTSCHFSTTGPSGVYDLLDTNQLVLQGLVIEGQPNQSPLYKTIASGGMPPSGTLVASDQLTIYQWIAVASPTPTPTP